MVHNQQTQSSSCSTHKGEREPVLHLHIVNVPCNKWWQPPNFEMDPNCHQMALYCLVPPAGKKVAQKVSFLNGGGAVVVVAFHFKYYLPAADKWRPALCLQTLASQFSMQVHIKTCNSMFQVSQFISMTFLKFTLKIIPLDHQCHVRRK